MGDDNIRHISDKKRTKDSIKDAIRRAKQHIRNVNAEDLDEPEGFASGDMEKFLGNPDEYDNGECDERDEDK